MTFDESLVELFRAAAAELEGTGLNMHEADRITLRFRLACRLRDLAGELCSHPRVIGGRCRYCGCRTEAPS